MKEESSKERVEKVFPGWNSYDQWKQGLSEPVSGGPMGSDGQFIEDGDGIQYHVTIQKDARDKK